MLNHLKCKQTPAAIEKKVIILLFIKTVPSTAVRVCPSCSETYEQLTDDASIYTYFHFLTTCLVFIQQEKINP